MIHAFFIRNIWIRSSSKDFLHFTNECLELNAEKLERKIACITFKHVSKQMKYENKHMKC